jgi:holo-[acyl-carrier protein] synthase
LLSTFDFGSERVRVGIDVVSVSQFEKQSTTKAGVAFTQSRFTKDELTYCEDRPERLAARWAAKEAIVKAIGSGFRGIRPRDIEIRHESWGEPTVVCPPGAVWPNDAHLWTWVISLAHENDAAVAIALAVANQCSSRLIQSTE